MSMLFALYRLHLKGWELSGVKNYGTASSLHECILKIKSVLWGAITRLFAEHFACYLNQSLLTLGIVNEYE